MIERIVLHGSKECDYTHVTKSYEADFEKRKTKQPVRKVIYSTGLVRNDDLPIAYPYFQGTTIAISFHHP